MLLQSSRENGLPVPSPLGPYGWGRAGVIPVSERGAWKLVDPRKLPLSLRFEPNLKCFEMNTKRVFDVIVTLLASVTWVPVFVVCVLAIAILDGRPVFYVSRRRVGRDTIRIIKFRTMMRDAERVFNRESVPVSNNIRFLNTPADSPLYTPIGRIIERLALTEIPQLLHVLKGDMSLVGNRPLPESVVAALAEAFPQVTDRFLTPAGITGPVQLVGRSAISDEDRLMLEGTYCRVARGHYSWRLDFMILLYTVLVTQRLVPPFGVTELRQLMLGFAGSEHSPVLPPKE